MSAIRDHIRATREVYLDDLREKAKDPLRYPGAAGYQQMADQVVRMFDAQDSGDLMTARWHASILRAMVMTPEPDRDPDRATDALRYAIMEATRR